MRAVACKNHAVMNEASHATALEGVDAVPLRREPHTLAQHAADQGFDILRSDACAAIDVPAELKVEPPDIVGLLVKQRRLARIEGRIEPEPALGRARLLYFDIGNEKVVLEDAPVEIQAHHFAYR